MAVHGTIHADDEQTLVRIQEAFRKQLLAIKPDMELPF